MWAEAFGGTLEVGKSTMWGNKEMAMVESDDVLWARCCAGGAEKVDTVDTLIAEEGGEARE